MITIPTYNSDNRDSLSKLYAFFDTLDKKIWKKETIYIQSDEIRKKQLYLPILAYTTKKKGPALWLISGIHGEEPAGPNAIANEIALINKLAKKIPIVLIPLCNPKGYRKNWRYPSLKRWSRNLKTTPSVSAADHLVFTKNGTVAAKKASSEEAHALTSYVLTQSKQHPPQLVIDLHEDDSLRKTYLYVNSDKGAEDPIAKHVVQLLLNAGERIQIVGKTRFGEPIINGLVANSHDGSIDELLASKTIWLNNKKVKGPGAKTVVVVETIAKRIPLHKRVAMHASVIRSIPLYWEMLRFKNS